MHHLFPEIISNKINAVYFILFKFVHKSFDQNFETLKRENGPESKLSGLIDFNIIDENKNKVFFILVHSQIKSRRDLLIWLLLFAVNIWLSLDNIGYLLT